MKNQDSHAALSKIAEQRKKSRAASDVSVSLSRARFLALEENIRSPRCRWALDGRALVTQRDTPDLT
jgi:hypothetical protein